MRPIDLQKEDFSEKERRNIEILKILRRRGPISRPEISKETGINVVTISSYIDDLIERDLVYEKEFDVSEGGRRPLLLDLNSKSGYIIGVGLNLMSMVGLLIDLRGNIITKTQIARPEPVAKEISECILEIIREVLRRSKEYAADIKGIGIGIAGLVDKKNNTIHWPQKIDHYYAYESIDLSLKDLIEKEFNFPVLIENDATCACFGEYWLNLEHNLKNIIYMFSGVGCGIMINGEIYTGRNGYAGEVSIYNKKESFDCALDNGCFLRRWELDLGIVEDVKSRLIQNRQAQEAFFKITSTELGNIDLKSVFVASRAKDPIAVSALDTAAKKLGIKIAFLVNLLNPEIVIIGGGLEEAGDEFLNKINLTVKDWAFKEATEDLKVIYSQLRENAVACGAASLVMQRLFAQLV